MTTFIIDHQCPQCGAPAELAETDRLFRCSFCRVASCLTVADHFRYVLPHKAPAGKTLFFFPYWRFKGMYVACLESGIESRIVDVSHQALPSRHLPFSVGLRSQTQRLRFAAGETGGRFLKVRTGRADFLSVLNQRLTEEIRQPILHQVHIGEVVSLLYAPFYLDDRLYDALLNQPLPGAAAEGVTPLLADAEQSAWPIRFVAALCPHCGDDLSGACDTLVLTCANCRSAWTAENDRLTAIDCAHMAGSDPDPVFLPFWRMRAELSPIALDSYADLIKTANLPRIAAPGSERQPLFFYAPAFKLPPRNLLSAAASVTINPPSGGFHAGPPTGRLQSVRLPLSDAVETIKPAIAGFMRPRERMVEALPEIRLRLQSATLVYLPFTETHHELVHRGLRLAVHKNVISHSRNL